MAERQDKAFTVLGFTKTTSNEGLVSYSRDLDQARADNPIIVLIHGYPQSSYMYAFHISLPITTALAH